MKPMKPSMKTLHAMTLPALEELLDEVETQIWFRSLISMYLSQSEEEVFSDAELDAGGYKQELISS